MTFKNSNISFFKFWIIFLIFVIICLITSPVGASVQDPFVGTWYWGSPSSYVYTNCADGSVWYSANVNSKSEITHDKWKNLGEGKYETGGGTRYCYYLMITNSEVMQYNACSKGTDSGGPSDCDLPMDTAIQSTEQDLQQHPDLAFSTYEHKIDTMPDTCTGSNANQNNNVNQPQGSDNNQQQPLIVAQQLQNSRQNFDTTDQYNAAYQQALDKYSAEDKQLKQMTNQKTACQQALVRFIAAAGALGINEYSGPVEAVGSALIQLHKSAPMSQGGAEYAAAEAEYEGMQDLCAQNAGGSSSNQQVAQQQAAAQQQSTNYQQPVNQQQNVNTQQRNVPIQTNSQRGKLLYTLDLNPEQRVIVDTFEFFNPLAPIIDTYTDSANVVNDLHEGKPLSVLSTDTSYVLLDVASAGLDATPVGHLMSLPSWFNDWYAVGADLAKNF